MGELRDDWLREPKAQTAPVLDVEADKPPATVTAKPRYASKPRTKSVLATADGFAEFP